MCQIVVRTQKAPDIITRAEGAELRFGLRCLFVFLVFLVFFVFFLVLFLV